MATFQLNKLSTELILEILKLLGPGFFRQDVGRFTLSKRWYAIAWSFYIRDLELTNHSLVSLVDIFKSVSDGQHPVNKRILDEIKQNTVSVTILVDGWGKEPYETRHWDWAQEPGWARVANRRPTPEYNAQAWRFQLEDAIKKVGLLLGQPSARVRSTKLVAVQKSLKEASPGVSTTATTTGRPRSQSFFGLRTMMYFVHQYANLTDLEIDFPPDHMLGVEGHKGAHLCEGIRGRLPELRRLWIRLPQVCFCLLESRAEGEHMLKTDELSPFEGLESVVVVMSYDPTLVRNQSNGEGSGKGMKPNNYHTRKCSCQHNLHQGHGVAQMCLAMWRLGRRMKAGAQVTGRDGKTRVARLLWRSQKASTKNTILGHVRGGLKQGQEYEWVAFDGITGKLMVLEGANPAWGSEGVERIPGSQGRANVFADLFDERSSWTRMLKDSPTSLSSSLIPERWPHMGAVIRSWEARRAFCPPLAHWPSSGDPFFWN
ncbi:hypothetical protein V8F20_005118 [Naviculisporaceae sp. PSN 640]